MSKKVPLAEVSRQVADKITGKPMLLPRADDDPLGVYVIEPTQTDLTRLYHELDPEEDEDFNARVHTPNELTLALLLHWYHQGPPLLEALQGLLEANPELATRARQLVELVNAAELVEVPE